MKTIDLRQMLDAKIKVILDHVLDCTELRVVNNKRAGFVDRLDGLGEKTLASQDVQLIYIEHSVSNPQQMQQNR